MDKPPKRPRLGMTGTPPSQRPAIPEDPADHAADFAQRYAVPLDLYCAIRMQELGIPRDKQGADDLRPYMKWCAFDPHGRDGGSITSGIIVNSGVLNPDLLKGKKGGRTWPKARLRDRIDATIAHEWAESQHVDHEAALKAAARTELPVSDGAKRILRAMAR
jgi:hypothetical protein